VFIYGQTSPYNNNKNIRSSTVPKFTVEVEEVIKRKKKRKEKEKKDEKKFYR